MMKNAEIHIHAFGSVLSMPLKSNHRRRIHIYFLTDASGVGFVMYHAHHTPLNSAILKMM